MAPQLQAQAVFWEPEPTHVLGMHEVARLNGYSNETTATGATSAAHAPQAVTGDYRVFADFFRTETFVEVAEKVPVVHYFDMDIQMAEIMLCNRTDEALLNLISSKVKLLKIGTHSDAIHKQLLQCRPDNFRLVSQQPGGYARFGAKGGIELFLRQDKSWSKIRERRMYVPTAVGPVLNWDGTIVFENNRFAEKC